ncbi:MAG: hypothetical protein EWM47_05625 [Anaerolineaceae bacterium]|nr:MAG: hypothetical protein EWM47_05625 [Anaerolineaceae bacterium]
MRFKRKFKRTTKQYIIVALICIIVIGSAAIVTSIITIGQIRDEYESVINEARQDMENNKKTVYIAKSDISAGDIISIDVVEQNSVYSAQPAESYISKDELGKAAIINIPQGTHIIKTMITGNMVSSQLREVEYDVIHISSNIRADDYVDVRIIFPNGENYIVATKKSLKGFQPGTPICYMWVNEEELLRMSAAIVDAGLYQGSRLYMTKYIEPNIQDASYITYTPNVSVLSLIENDPNIVERYSQILNKEVRKAMENRLTESIGLDVSEIRWELDETEIRYMPVIPGTQSKEDVGYMETNQGIIIGPDIGSANESSNGTDNWTYNESDNDTDDVENNEADNDFDRNHFKENKVDKNVTETELFFPELGRTDIYDYENSIFATEG